MHMVIGEHRGYPRDIALASDIGIPVAAFAVAAAVAELAGAANLGVALGVGQLAFTGALVFVLLRR
ncbi:MAG: hypothetical protein ACR2K6_11930 [Solirubrobacterales bacterium]